MKKLWRDLVLYSTGLATTLVITLVSIVFLAILATVMAVIKIITYIR